MKPIPPLDYTSFVATSGNRVIRTEHIEEFPGKNAIAERIVWRFRASPADTSEFEAWIAERIAESGMVAAIENAGLSLSTKDATLAERERLKLEEWKRRKGLGQ